MDALDKWNQEELKADYWTDPLVTDTRDLRDPQKLGENLLYHASIVNAVADAPRKTLSQIFDEREVSAPNYPQDESMAVLTAREYRAELEERKKAGDKYAASAIAALDKGGKVEYDDPSGN